MKNNFTKELIVSVVLIILTILLLNPFNILMLKMATITILGITVVVFGLFASYVLREDVRDEREGVHRMYAGRSAFLVGSSVMLLGLFIQAWWNKVDIWLVVSLVSMILAKIAAHYYSERNL